MNDYISVLKKYAVFSGRASRREYWMFFAFNIIVAILTGIIDAATGVPVLGPLYSLAVLIPGIAVTIRRLHDTDHSGWWILVGLVPFVGFLVLLYFMIIEGTKGGNQFGPPATSAG